jgi:type IV pilus assembly protein PilM
MSLLNRITQLVQDPVPSLILEFSEAGIAYSRNGEAGFAVLEPGTLVASPVQDNIHRTDALSSVLARVIPPARDPRKKRPAVVILPDYAVRVSVLDFDSFPSSPDEQLSLIRFRLKKTLPFDVESAAVSYFVQTPREKEGKGASGKIEVVAASVAVEVLARYEALCRAANLHPGEITVSALASLQLFEESGVCVLAKLAGRTLTVMVTQDNRLKLFRCVELEDTTEKEVLGVLHPTLAYVEDGLSSRDCRIILCGFAKGALPGLGRPSESLKSALGEPHAFNAGLLGYLQGAHN